MKNNDIERFKKITRRADRVNKTLGKDRFIPINSFEFVGLPGNQKRIPVYGMYDYVSKRHIISEPFVEVDGVFTEIEQMLAKAS